MIWLAYYLVVIPILVMLLIPGDRAPRWLFYSTILAASCGVWLTVYVFGQAHLT